MNYPFLDESLPIQWHTLTSDRIEPDMREALRRAEQLLQQLADTNIATATYADTFAMLERIYATVQRPWTLIGHLDSVTNSDALRDAYNKMLPEVTSFLVNIALNGQVWSVLKAVGERVLAGNTLHDHERRYVEETLAEFREAGADLAEAPKKELIAVQADLSQATQKFSENVLDATKAFDYVITDRNRLSGLPESAIEAARLNALSKGLGSESEPQYRFTLQYPSMAPVMQYADDEELRKVIIMASVGRASSGDFDNTGLLRNILQLRQRKATLLGKKDFTEVVTARRMVRSGTNALRFVEDLHARTQSAFKVENEELEQYKASVTGANPAPLAPWEHAYWSEKLRKSRYDLDEEEVRTYFPIESVLSGMFDLTSRIFGIRVEERTGNDKPPVWHPDVGYFELFDNETDRLIGSFYTDWYPRDDKRGGAWMNLLHTADRSPGASEEPHVGLMCGNMNAPVGDQPALLNHREVETVFHEFGHLLHHLLGDVRVKALNGVNVAWDFVELPSQIMENWTWEREALDLFARHYETGERIPAALFDKMIAARNFQVARGQMRQLAFGKMDLELHLQADKFLQADLDKAIDEMLADYLVPVSQRLPQTVRSFTHIFGDAVGYASGYYSYKWAEVLDADAFTRFKAEGILNAQTGLDFRFKILAPGNSKPLMCCSGNSWGVTPIHRPCCAGKGW
ncbi:MAG: M3 family metallopeptidase [Verrucomicrobia bacterium]|nr:M3 family metallopeptidase [Verrucomicrobiota bacterium]